MDEKKDFFYFDTTLGKIVSEEKHNNHTKDEFIIPKEKKKTLVFEHTMPFYYTSKTSDEGMIFLDTQEELEDRSWYFIDSFNRWSIESSLMYSEETFGKVFKEENKYAFFGLNFESNKHYVLNSIVYEKDGDKYYNQYPNYDKARLMFYYDIDKDSYEVIFTITTKLSSIKHNDADHFHTIILKRTLLPMHSNDSYVDFFYSMMCLIKGINIYTSDTELEEILNDSINQ